MRILAPIIILFAVSSLYGCVSYQQPVDEPNELAITEIPELRKSTITITPTSTQETAPTETSTLTPEPTPTPRIWSREIYEEFMYSGTYPVVNLILYGGWNDYDGIGLLDDYPCYLCCPFDRLEAEIVIQNAYNENNIADFWCEWACQAVYHGFGPILRSNIISNYYYLNSLYGNPDKEPYCPQFADTSKTDPGYRFYRDFNCNVIQPTPTPVPIKTLGWNEHTRKMIEDNYLWTILNDEFLINWPVQDGPKPDWTLLEVQNLSDTEVCWIIANGHYIHGFPEHLPADEEKGCYLYYDIRMQLRDELHAALGESIDGNPPLCPNFLEMIDQVWIQEDIKH